MRIATRLYLGFAIILVLMLGLTAYGIFQVVQVDNRLTKVNQQDSVEQRTKPAIRANFPYLRRLASCN